MESTKLRSTECRNSYLSYCVFIITARGERGEHLAAVLSCILKPDCQSLHVTLMKISIERDQICNAEGGAMLAVSTQP